MQPEVLKAVIDFFCQNQESVEFIWHGGEPMLAGLDFYRKVAEIQYEWRQKGRGIKNFIQTNATLITPEWTRFFVDNDFLVGISLDGPKEIHDEFRCYPNNAGSFEDVMGSIKLLRQVKIFNGVICGISIANYRYPKEIFNFFVAEDMKKLKFARIKNIGNCNDISSLVISPAQYTDFMITIFDLWLELDDPEVEIRDIQSVVDLILGGSRRECIYMGQCDQFVTVYSDGSIYACDSFPKVAAARFGSVLDGSATVKSNLCLQNFQKLLGIRRERCQTCDWYFICRGGCAMDCYGEAGAIEPIIEVCESLRKYFAHISAKIKSYDII